MKPYRTVNTLPKVTIKANFSVPRNDKKNKKILKIRPKSKKCERRIVNSTMGNLKKITAS